MLKYMNYKNYIINYENYNDLVKHFKQDKKLQPMYDTKNMVKKKEDGS